MLKAFAPPRREVQTTGPQFAPRNLDGSSAPFDNEDDGEDDSALGLHAPRLFLMKSACLIGSFLVVASTASLASEAAVPSRDGD